MRQPYGEMLLAAFMLAAVVGCANIPGPETALPEDNCQMRLAEAQVTASGYFTATSASGQGCVFTKMGKCPGIKSLSSEMARCTVVMDDGQSRPQTQEETPSGSANQ